MDTKRVYAVFPWLLVALAWLVWDQWSKYWIIQHYQLYDSTTITSFFNIVRVHNTGAAFSFLADAGGWQRWFFTVLGLAASALFIWMLYQNSGRWLFAFSVASILGGAIGNVLDRLQHGYVVDMLDFHWDFLSTLFYRGHFPAFNVADIAISIGAAGIILSEIVLVYKDKRCLK